jgi:type I restriction enzyme S subunit
MNDILDNAVFYSDERIAINQLTIENYISTDNLLQNKLGKVNAEKLPPQKGNVTKFSTGDILISNIRPYLKKIWLAKHDGGSSADVLTLKVKPKFDSTFVYYSLFRDDFFEYMIKGSKGTKMPRGDKNQILNFHIPEFNKTTQQKIAKVLSDLDSKIELNNKINSELEAMAKILYDYWFVQFDFPDSNGKPYKTSGGKMVWNEELKREIPEGWEVKELGRETTIHRGISYKSSEINGEGIPMISLNSFNLDGTYKPEGIKNYSGKYTEKNIVSRGDLLIAVTDVTRNADIIGKAIIVPDYYSELVISMDIAKIVPSEKLTESYLMMLFNSKHYHNYIKWYASGTIVLHLNLDGMNWYKAEIPSKYLLDKFDKFYKPIAKRISETKKQNQEIASQRDWLLPMLMNGQVSVGEVISLRQAQDDELGMVAESGESYGK